MRLQTRNSNAADISEESQRELAPVDFKQSAQRQLAAGVLKQAALDLRRFHGVTTGAGRTIYCDACRWLTSNEYSSPFAFLNVCRALGLAPETVRAELISNLSLGTFRSWRRRLAAVFTL